MINFEKSRDMARTILQLKQYQESQFVGSSNPSTTNAAIIHYLRNLPALSEHDLLALSKSYE